MCGLHGYFADVKNGFSNSDWDIACANAWINQWRGIDSTGLVLIDNKAGYRWIKEVGDFAALIAHEGFDKFKKDTLGSGIMLYGHGRYATRGKVDVANAHPFVAGKDNKEIILVHNGTLSDSQQMAGIKKYTVDSEWLANMVVQHGAEDAFAHLSGAAACIWYDIGETKLHIYRNDERPLFVVGFQPQGVTGKRYLLNSEVAALMWLKHKFNLPYNDDDIKTFPKETIYTMDPFNIANGWTKIDVPRKHDWWPKYELPKSSTTVYAGPEVQRLPFSEKKAEVSYLRPNVGGENEPPSYSHAILMLLKNEAKSFEWGQSGNVPVRWSMWADGTSSRVYGEQYAPYEKDLYKLERVTDNVIRKHFSGYKVEVRFDITTLENVIRDVDGIKEPNNTPVKVPSSFKWRTKVGAVEVKHKAIPASARNSEKYFSYYENNLDGKIKKDEVVQIEVKDVEVIEKEGVVKTYRVWCDRLRPEPDHCIEFMFQKAKWTEEQLYRIGHFEGKVACIRSIEEDLHHRTDAAVVVMLSGVEPLNNDETALWESE